MAEVTSDLTKNIWRGGLAPMKASWGKLMMWFFLLSDAFTFTALLISYGMERFFHPGFEGLREQFTFSDAYWPVPEKVFNAMPFLHGIDLPLIFVSIMTFILILSSVTMVLAVEAGERRDQAGVTKWLLWTVLGGVAFLGCQAWEWTHFIIGDDTGTILENGQRFFGANLVANQYGPPLFADFFFFITGFHGFHVTSGVVINMIVLYNVIIGTYHKRNNYEIVEKIGLYWHFVDLVWVFVFTLFYLI